VPYKCTIDIDIADVKININGTKEYTDRLIDFCNGSAATLPILTV